MSELTRNPDILTCLANLSNDEVFTPPEVANAMLDLIPEDFWKDPNVRVFDPACKSGIFLREAAKRFLKGEEEIIPDLQERIDHIFHKQLFGYAITELTAHLARRTVYCSKTANGKYSVTPFKSENGNIAFSRVEHTWEDGKCKYCGASQEVFDRGEEAETHAYKFIHLTSQQIKDLDMKFDLIIGNPPYQLNDGGGVGSAAKPIYHLFIQQAKKLKPRYLSMITPSRWFSGGKGLDEFRDEMLHDKRLKIIHDFPNARDCFAGVEIKGGVSYFLWMRDYKGDCNIVSHDGDKILSDMTRPLLEKGFTTFVRNNSLVPIIHKIRSKTEQSFKELISSNDPFGFDTRIPGTMYRKKADYTLAPDENHSIKFYYNNWRKDGIGYVSSESIRKHSEWVDKCKILIPKAWGSGDPQTDWLKPFIVTGKACCTETYLVIGPFQNKETALNIVSYVETKFFHALVSACKITQNTMQDAYQFVPMQDFSKPWTDKELYEKYGLTDEEIAFIESMIKPME